MSTLALMMLLFFVQQPEQVRVELEDGTVIVAHNGPATKAGDVHRAEGDLVEVTYQDVKAEARWAEYNVVTKLLTAGDQVRFTRGDEQLEGGKLSFNLGTKTGTMSDVTGQVDPGFNVTAGEAERLANGSWILRSLRFTSCKSECPVWDFKVGEALVEPGNRITGRGTWFRVRGLPLVFLPYLMVPTTSRDRSSGFLIPSTSTSTSKGRSISETFYWAPSRSYDAFFTGEYFSKRGPAGTVNFRGVPRANTQFDVISFFADDRLGQGGLNAHVTATSNFNGSWRGVADMAFVTSFPFRQTWEEGISTISSPLERSNAFLTKNGEKSSLNFQYNRSAAFFPEQSAVLRKFPDVNLSLPMRSLTRGIPVYFSFDGGWAGTARRDRGLSTPPLMQRIDIHPALDIPLVRTSAVEWSHRVSARNTTYTHSLRPDLERRTLNRGTFEYSTLVKGPQLERSFGKWKHIVEPTVEYRYVTGAESLENTVIVDEADLIANTNEVEYAVTNRFLAGHEFLSWRVAQKLYFSPDFGGALQPGRRNTIQPLMDLTGFAFSDGTPRRFSPLVSTVRIATTPASSTDILVDYDTGMEEFRSAGVMGNLARGPVSTSIGYFFNKRNAIQAPSNQLRALLLYGSGNKPGLSAGFTFYYDILHSLFQGSTAQVGYNTDCFGLSFDYTQYDIGPRRETRFRFALSLKNLGSFGTLGRQERIF